MNYDELKLLHDNAKTTKDIDEAFRLLKIGVKEGLIDNIQNRELIQALKKRRAMINQGLIK